MNIILSECVSEYASFKSGYISNSTFVLCLWLSVHLFCRLKKQVSAACKQLLWYVPFVSTMWVYVFPMHLALSLAFVSAWIASIWGRCVSPKSVAGKFLYMKAANGPYGIWKTASGYDPHGIWHTYHKYLVLVNTHNYLYNCADRHTPLWWLW